MQLAWLIIVASYACHMIMAIKFLGPYCAMLESLEDLNDIPRDKIDWKLYIRKTGRSDQDLVGYMLVKEKVGPVGLTLHIEKYVEGIGWRNFMVDKMSTSNVCTDKIYKNVMENYNGTMTPDCIFIPEKKFLSPLNINNEIHRYSDETILGKFRVAMRFHDTQRDVMGFQSVYDIKWFPLGKEKN